MCATRRDAFAGPEEMTPETFLGVGYTRDRAGLPLEAVRIPVPQPAADEVLIRVAASSLNPPSTSWPTSISWGGPLPSFLASTFRGSSSRLAMACAAWLWVTRWPP